MSSLYRLALPVLAVAGSAYAACSHTATSTIQNSGDASAIATCKTFSGNIAIKTDAAGPIALDGVQVIDGTLSVENNKEIQQISADSLEEITSEFVLKEAPKLNIVSFPKLKTVGALQWIGLASLQNLGFDAEITKADNIRIENTQLQSLEGINIETIETMFVANNLYINTIDMQLGNITDSLTLSTNNPDVNVTFPNLIWAANMTFRNCSSVDLPSLEAVNKSFSLIGNVFDKFMGPNLTTVGGALVISDNTELTNISFPLLTKVGFNLEVANNTKLREIKAFPQLETISGALDFNGNMSKIELPKIGEVKGAFNIQSTGEVQETCDKVFEPLKDDGTIRGEFFCKGFVANPGGEGTTPTVTGAGAKKTGNAAASLDVTGNAMLFGIAAAFFL
jgi:hypothetical protein